MSYEPVWGEFTATGPDGECRDAKFLRAGFLTVGDRPELYFFRVAREEVVVAISGGALRRFETGRRSLSREEKIDVTGLLLKQQIEVGKALDSENLFVRDEELAKLAGELGIPV